MTSFTVTTNSPIGQLTLRENNGFITHCGFTKNDTRGEKTSSLLNAALLQLDEYFAGQRASFNLPIAPTGTRFQIKVWTTLQTIPYGQQWSYQQTAQKLANPKAYRAVGTANAKNPICIFIPCHRVILASGQPGHYAGGIEAKITLLELEKNKLLNSGL